MGFDRVYPPSVELKDFITDLKNDLKISKDA